jgi:hypothetical protein
LLIPLDNKVASIMRSPAYRILDWFATEVSHLAWFVCPQADLELRPC